MTNKLIAEARHPAAQDAPSAKVRDLLDRLADALEAAEMILGRCDETNNRTRCDRPKGHSGSHESSDRGYMVWTNQNDWTPAE